MSEPLIDIGDLVKLEGRKTIGWVIAVDIKKQFRVEWSNGNKFWYNYNILRNLNREIVMKKVS